MKRLLLLLASSVLVAGCIDSRASVDVPTFAGPLGDPTALSLADGTTVSLTRAQVAFDDVLFEEPAVAARWSLIPEARAHAGHDDSGAEVGELPGHFEVDLLDGEAELGTARLLDGEYATARMRWAGAVPSVVLEGSATPPGAAAVPFAFSILEEREVTNMPFVAAVDTESPPAALHLSIDLARILGESDFSTPDDNGDGVLTAADGDLAATVRFGARTSAAYTWEIR